jgi:hypothetical protein
MNRFKQGMSYCLPVFLVCVTVAADALAQLIGYVEHNWTRIRYLEPWHHGLVVGSGVVEGACKPVIQNRLKRAGMQ